MKKLTFIITLLGSLYSMQSHAYLFNTTSIRSVGEGYFYAEIHHFDTTCIGSSSSSCFDIKVIIINNSSSSLNCQTQINNMSDSFGWRSSPTGNIPVGALSSEISQSHISISGYDNVTLFCTVSSSGSGGNGGGGNSNSGSSNTVYQGSVDMQCPCSYNINNNILTMNVDRINNNSGYRSGTLSIAVMASDSPYSGSGTLYGYLIGEVSLNDTLQPNEYYYNITQSTNLEAPPDGTYSMIMLVLEGGQIVDYGNFSGTETFSGNGGSNSSPNGDDISLDCPCSYKIDNGTVNLVAARINNDRSGGYSGTLKLKLWATDTPYTGGTISGYTLAEYRFSDALDGGQYYYDIDTKTAYNPPPDGTYYITMTLTEYTPDGDVTRDHFSYSTPKTLSAPSVNTFNGGGSSGTGSGTGSGSLSLWMIPAFGLIFLIRRLS